YPVAGTMAFSGGTLYVGGTNGVVSAISGGSTNSQLADPNASYWLNVPDNVFSTVILGSGNNIVIGNSTLPTNIVGGNGTNVLVGGSGKSTLNGGSGADILIGGTGASTLKGNGGDDILIGGTLSFSSDFTGLAAIESEWSSADPYSTRIAKLMSGVGSAN